MMKKLLILLVFLSIFSCNQKEEYDFKGNWSFIDETEYVEVFINDSIFLYYFTSMGWVQYNYSIEQNNKLLLIEESDTIKFSFSFLNNDSFILKFEDGKKDTLNKIHDNEYTIENIFKDKNEQKFLDAFFDRMKEKRLSIFDKRYYKLDTIQ